MKTSDSYGFKEEYEVTMSSVAFLPDLEQRVPLRVKLLDCKERERVLNYKSMKMNISWGYIFSKDHFLCAMNLWKIQKHYM